MQQIEMARYWLIKKYPYLSHAIYSLRYVESKLVPTMAVDASWNLYYNPSYIADLTVPQIGAVLYHEILHLLRQHAVRLAHYPEWVANLAADAEINDDIRAEGFELPDGAVYPEVFGWELHQLAEHYANALMQQFESGLNRGDEQDESRGSQGSEPQRSAMNGNRGDEQDESRGSQGSEPQRSAMNGNRGDEQDESRGSQGSEPQRTPVNGSGANGRKQVWETAPQRHPVETQAILNQVARDIASARDPGKVPAHLKRVAQELVKPRKVDWRIELASVLRNSLATVAGAVDYTYQRPSRRQSVYAPIVMPSLRQPMPRVAVVVDTSGSVRDRELGLALGVIDDVVRSIGVGVRVYAVDCEVYGACTALRGRDAERILVGGGGTDMRVGIEAALRGTPRPDVIVVITDGYTPWHDAPPSRSVKVIGVLTKPVAAPNWIKVIRAEVDGGA